jgi:NAD(P)-dependent dehydrogenase (short-subunit alcohol dehydrogenase family)
LRQEDVALITGSSKGIGVGIARALASAGIKVILTYKTNADKASQLAYEINESGHQAIAVELIAEDRNSVRDAIKSGVENFGPISIVVNNAAFAQEKPFQDITDVDWNFMMGVNLRGPFSIIQETIPYMVENRFGRIINISSIGGQWGGLNQVHYAASKSALINLTRSIAKIYSKYGITSNAIAPGLVATEMSENELKTSAGRKKVEAIPSSRLGTIEEIGMIAKFLASEEAGYITGQTINANGGMYFSSS